MTINLVETDGSYPDDIQNYLSCIHFKGHLSFINVDGGPSDAQGESTLDVQMVAGLAPAASIKVYQTDGNAGDDPWTQVDDELQHILDSCALPNTSSAWEHASREELCWWVFQVPAKPCSPKPSLAKRAVQAWQH